MNVKIKTAGVACLLGDNYDRIYSAIKKQIPQGGDSLFTERTPGNNYLQWELPGDGWQSLKDCDPLAKGEVKKELIRRQNAVRSLFGSNNDLAQKILSVPDDSYVYFKTNPNGHLDIKLTAWGYLYPERVSTGAGIGVTTPKTATEHVYINLEYGGESLPNHDFRINGFPRITDADGRYDVGDLPEGYQFDIEVDGHKQHVTVATGAGNITLDLTKYSTVEVIVTKDGQPYQGTPITLDYGKVHQVLTTDATGKAVTKFPLSLSNDNCTVAVENENQSKELTEQTQVFRFALTSPPAEPAEAVQEEPIKEGPAEEDVPSVPLAEEKPKEVIPQVTEEPAEEEEESKPAIPEEEQKNKTPFWMYLLYLLFILLLIVLTVATFYLGGGILFYL